MEQAMPISEIILLTAIVVVFVGFAAALGWADYQTRDISQWPGTRD
jgi:multisubunit Na+/H+ antiporter MnhC subunit